MKVFKKIVLWVVISLTLQLSGLFYANNYILTSDTSPIKTKKIVKKTTKSPEIKIDIPDEAKNISLSYDGRFAAYYTSDGLKVIDTKNGQQKNVNFGSDTQISFYKWIPNRNRMLIAEKSNLKLESNITLAYYDVDKNVKEDIKELDWADKNSEVEDIQASPLTNVIYVKVANGGKRSSIYWINVMKELKKVETKAYMIGNIEIIPHEDKLVYEDLTYHKIYATDQEQSIDVDGVDNPSLLGIDDDDNIYIGESDGDKISKIFYGNIKENTSNFKSIDLNSPFDKNDIYVNSQGNIYVNDNFKGIVTEMKNGKQYKYPGTFIQIYDNGIASVSDGKLLKTSID